MPRGWDARPDNRRGGLWIGGGRPGIRPADLRNSTPLAVVLTADADPPPRYTLHLDFTADDTDHARTIACELAEGLGVLRAEVDMYSALLSTATEPEHAMPVFCRAPGPDDAVCADVHGHPGWHWEAAIGGVRWRDGAAQTRGNDDTTGG